SLMRPDNGTPGNGLLLFFCVDDYKMALKRARTLVVRFEEEPHVNPNTQTWEFCFRAPDAYYVTISAFSPLQQSAPPRRSPNKQSQSTKARRRTRKSRQR